MTYASVSRGYKAGAFNSQLVGDTHFKFAAETAWNYEIGLKSMFLDDRVTFNVAAFYFDWQDPQVSVFNGFFFTTSNARSARSFGGECELVARPLPGFDVNVGGGYADATFVRFDNFLPGQSAAGHRVPYTSKFTANAAVQYRLPLTAWIALMLRWDAAYKSSLFYDVANSLKEPGYVLVNVRLGLESERWDFFGFVRNMFDERYRTMGFLTPTQGPIGAPGDPRTYGVQVRIRF
jgi:iron complex outermembrane receptor protein